MTVPLLRIFLETLHTTFGKESTFPAKIGFQILGAHESLSSINPYADQSKILL